MELDMSGDTSNKVDTDHALVLLVTEILHQLDEFYALRKQGSKAMISHELLREMCSVLPDLDEELQERYLEILVSISSKKEAYCPITPSEEMVAATVSPKRKTLDAISEKLGIVKAA